MLQSLIIAAALVVATTGAPDQAAAGDTDAQIDRYLAWLSDPTRQWLATAHLQQAPQPAIARLLQPGRMTTAPHGELSAAGLALAKIGPAAIPSIAERLRTILVEKDPRHGAEITTLIDVLRENGPPAVPVLVGVAESSPEWATWALDAIGRMERRPGLYGQTLSPWVSWKVAGERHADVERAIVPFLPRIEKLMIGAAIDPQSDVARVVRPAAYLLARWGSASESAGALRRLEDVARDASFHGSLEVIRTMHALDAPHTAAAIKSAARRVPANDELQGAYLLSMAVALHQLGDSDYGALIDEAIRSGRPVDRIDAARFLGQTENLADVPRLIALLGDDTRWSGRTVAQAAIEGLWTLTLEVLPADPDAWQAWYAAASHRGRHAVLEAWTAARRRQLARTPIWEVNGWIERLAGTRDAAALPLIVEYLRRADLRANATGPSSSIGGTGAAPGGKRAPTVVTLLLGMAQANVPGALAGLDACLDAVDPEVRMFGAVALAAYLPRRAADALARELTGDEPAHRYTAAELLLHLGDPRGIAPRIDALELGARVYGGGLGSAREEELNRGVRMFACRDLRVFSQQPLPCEPTAQERALATQVAAWRRWAATAAGQPLRLEKARLDLEAVYRIRPVTVGEQLAY